MTQGEKIRIWVSTKLTNIALKIYPSNRVMQFYEQYLLDMAIYGGAITRINPTDTYKESANDTTTR